MVRYPVKLDNGKKCLILAYTDKNEQKQMEKKAFTEAEKYNISNFPNYKPKTFESLL